MYVRYWLAVMMLFAVPGVVFIWSIIHPFIGFWRKLGPRLTYPIVLALVYALAIGIYEARDRLLLGDMGANSILIGAGIVLSVLDLWLFAMLKRQLPWTTMLGLPELAPKNHRQPLIIAGIYARIRHPRYAQVLLMLLSWSLFINYVSIYALFIVSIPAFYFIAWLEERELVQRYGLEYEVYQRRVPMFIPKLFGS